MKCKICGKRTASIAAMAKHYRNEHPQYRKHKASPMTKAHIGRNYCPTCGRKL